MLLRVDPGQSNKHVRLKRSTDPVNTTTLLFVVIVGLFKSASESIGIKAADLLKLNVWTWVETCCRPTLMITIIHHKKIGLKEIKKYSKQPRRKQLYVASSWAWHLVWKGGLDLLTRPSTEEKENSEVDNWSDWPPGRITGLSEDTRIRKPALIHYDQNIS